VVGIVDLEFEFPKSRVTVEHMHAESGRPVADILAWTHCQEIPVFGEHEPAWELVSEVAQRVLERTGVRPEDIGQVIVAGSGRWDQPGWSPAAKVAAELDITGAHCFEVINFCHAGPTAMRIAADAIAAGRERYSLVLLGEQAARGVDYTDPESVSGFSTGDCAVAVLMGPEGSRFELLDVQSRTDPSWSDYYVGEYEDGRMVTRRRGRRLNLPQTYLKNFEALATTTLSTLDRTVADVRYLLINHMDRRMHERLLRNLGIPAERSVFNYDRFGHMSGGDVFIALAELHAEGRLERSDLVLLATSGAGFSWGVTALEYR
jgi:3-oxoacyl-[acyl-carrier-protein] synthase-3